MRLHVLHGCHFHQGIITTTTGPDLGHCFHHYYIITSGRGIDGSGGSGSPTTTGTREAADTGGKEEGNTFLYLLGQDGVEGIGGRGRGCGVVVVMA